MKSPAVAVPAVDPYDITATWLLEADSSGDDPRNKLKFASYLKTRGPKKIRNPHPPKKVPEKTVNKYFPVKAKKQQPKRPMANTPKKRRATLSPKKPKPPMGNTPKKRRAILSPKKPKPPMANTPKKRRTTLTPKKPKPLMADTPKKRRVTLSPKKPKPPMANTPKKGRTTLTPKKPKPPMANTPKKGRATLTPKKAKPPMANTPKKRRTTLTPACRDDLSSIWADPLSPSPLSDQKNDPDVIPETSSSEESDGGPLRKFRRLTSYLETSQETRVGQKLTPESKFGWVLDPSPSSAPGTRVPVPDSTPLRTTAGRKRKKFFRDDLSSIWQGLSSSAETDGDAEDQISVEAQELSPSPGDKSKSTTLVESWRAQCVPGKPDEDNDNDNDSFDWDAI